MRPWLAGVAAALLLAGASPMAGAQVPPSAEEIARYTGLHAAAAQGDAGAIRALLSAGARLEVRDEAGRTPLHVATYARQREAIRALIAAGADANALEGRRYDPVTIASVAGDEETLALLLVLGASARNVTSPYDGTALIAAAHAGHVGIVRQLIAAGAPLDHVNNLHWTALIEAVVLGDGGERHTEIVRLLVAAGANRALTDRNGRTALDLARGRGYGAMVRLLQAPPPR
ncbi:MAG: ankyrin repeat domain-containing protein [Alphaproteobacteria bacterium]|nr:ankyrin repeat domain-containing protein [Alphaproteobacteria bacterium]